MAIETHGSAGPPGATVDPLQRSSPPVVASFPPRFPFLMRTGVPPQPRKRRSSALLPAVALGVALLALWQALTQSGAVSTFVLPAPASVAQAFWSALRDGVLPSYASVTLAESIAGCALGVLVALPLGYAIARSTLLARMVQPYLAASQALPAVALAPLLALWLGYGLPPVIVLCALIVFFPMVITTTLGLRSLDHAVVDAARVDGAGRLDLLRHIELPLALPSILAGLRTSLTLSITGAVVGEFVVGGRGLGELLVIDRSFADSAGVFATLLMLALMASLLYGIARLAERQFSYLEAL